MLNRIEAALTPTRRRWAYRLAWAALGLLGTYGLLSGDQSAAWAFLFAALFGVADGHTDPSTPTGQPARERQDHVDGSGAAE